MERRGGLRHSQRTSGGNASRGQKLDEESELYDGTGDGCAVCAEKRTEKICSSVERLVKAHRADCSYEAFHTL